MGKRRYIRISLLEAEIDEMLAQGKTHREIEAYFGLEGDRPLHNFLKRRRRKEKKLLSGMPRPRGRKPVVTLQEYKYEIKRLKMENELLRDFLRLAGRG